jgi:hypothetical protein
MPYMSSLYAVFVCAYGQKSVCELCLCVCAFIRTCSEEYMFKCVFFSLPIHVLKNIHAKGFRCLPIHA